MASDFPRAELCYLCPQCGASLWGCGTGNFKPWRMKVRKDVTECPTCHTPIT